MAEKHHLYGWLSFKVQGVCVCVESLSLSADPVNTSSLRDIETAMFTVCLDKTHPQLPSVSTPFRDPHAEIIAGRVLHGNGTQQNSCNRWFDSAVQVRAPSPPLIQLTTYTIQLEGERKACSYPMQIVVGEDGGCGSLLEHSAGDGAASMASNIFCMDLLVR